MNTIRKKIFLTFVLLFLPLCFAIKVQAEEGAGFTVTPILGTGQIDQSLGYFAIKVEREKTYPVTVNVQNLTESQNETFEVYLVKATTTNAGRIDYTPSEKKDNINGLYLKDILVNKKDEVQKFNLAPEKDKNISFNLKIPRDGIEGTILGSVYVKKIPKIDQKVDGTGVRNTFAMTIPVMLSEGFSKKVTPELSLKDAKLESSAGTPGLVGTVENSSPSMFGQISIEAWVTEKGKNTKLYNSKNNKYEMAPYSSFEYTIDTKNNIPKSGEYTYHVQMKSGDKVFSLDKDFTINRKGRETINEKLINKEENTQPFWMLYVALIVLGIIIIVGGYFLWKKRGKKVK